MNIEQYLKGIESCIDPQTLTDHYGIYFDNMLFLIRSEDPRNTFEQIRLDIGNHTSLEDYFLDGREVNGNKTPFMKEGVNCSRGLISQIPNQIYQRFLNLDHQLYIMFDRAPGEHFRDDDSVLAIKGMIDDFSRYFIEKGIKAILVTCHSSDEDINKGIFINTS